MVDSLFATASTTSGQECVPAHRTCGAHRLPLWCADNWVTVAEVCVPAHRTCGAHRLPLWCADNWVTVAEVCVASSQNMWGTQVATVVCRQLVTVAEVCVPAHRTCGAHRLPCTVVCRQLGYSSRGMCCQLTEHVEHTGCHCGVQTTGLQYIAEVCVPAHRTCGAHRLPLWCADNWVTVAEVMCCRLTEHVEHTGCHCGVQTTGLQ